MTYSIAADRRARIERDAGLLAERADRLQRAMQMRTGFGMHGDVVAAGFGKGLEIGIAGRDHQMGVEDLLGVRAHRLDDIGAVGNVRHEMPVHHVEMDPVGAGRIDRADLFAQPGEIRRQDRGRDDEGAWREWLGHVRFPENGRGMRMAPRNMRAAGQCGSEASCGAEKSAAAAPIAGLRGPRRVRGKPDFIGFFAWHGAC